VARVAPDGFLLAVFKPGLGWGRELRRATGGATGGGHPWGTTWAQEGGSKVCY